MPGIKERLQDLKSEYQAGQEQIRLLDARRQELQNTLLRISGAIQVLEELLAETPEPPEPPQ